MVRKFRRVTIVLLMSILMGWKNLALSEINEEIMSEIMSNKSDELEDFSIEKNNNKPIESISNSKNTINYNNKVVKENLPLSREQKANINYNKGLEAINSNQEIEATAFFKKALEENQQHHKARIQLIQLYRKIGWTDEVEKLLQKGLDLNPENGDLIKNLAILYQEKGQTRKALSILLTMPDFNANDIDYLALLALAYLNTEQPEMAEKYYQQLLNVHKENPNWWLGLAIAQYANGNYKNAIDSFNQSKTLGRFNNEILDYINNKLDEMKRY